MGPKSMAKPPKNDAKYLQIDPFGLKNRLRGLLRTLQKSYGFLDAPNGQVRQTPGAQKCDSMRGAQPAAPDVIEKSQCDSKLRC